MEPETHNECLGYADQYCLHSVLGTGGQASVYVGSKLTELYAIKVYLPGTSKELAFQFQTQFLNKLHFPLLINQVQCRPKATIKMKKLPQQKRPVVVLELAQGLDLFEYINKFGKFIPEVCRYYAKQIISTIQYLVGQNITHRDLKPENILLDKHFNLKISDFGLARDSRGDLGNGQLRSRVGTQGYRPPEMQLGRYTGAQADMFALGVILFIMFKGSPPFMSTKAHDRIYRLIRHNEYARFWQLHERQQPAGFYPDSFKRLLNSFFCNDPTRRPTFESLENDQWLNGPTFTHTQIVEYMKERYQPLIEGNPLRELRLKLLHQRMQKEKSKKQKDQTGMDQERYESDEEADKQLSIDQKFIKTVNHLRIKLEELPQFQKSKVVYVKEDPSFVVAWIKDFITNQQKKKQIFIKEYVGQIKTQRFYFRYVPKNHQIELTFSFYIGQGNEEDITSLELIGQVHKSQRKEVGIQWRKKTGNFYWLATIENKLAQCLKSLN